MKHTRYFDGIHLPERTRVFLDYMGKIMRTDFGRTRRDLFKKLYGEIPSLELYVNIEDCLQLKYDPDLRRLLKEGFLRRQRKRYGWYGKSSVTVLILGNLNTLPSSLCPRVNVDASFEVQGHATVDQ